MLEELKELKSILSTIQSLGSIENICGKLEVYMETMDSGTVLSQGNMNQEEKTASPARTRSNMEQERNPIRRASEEGVNNNPPKRIRRFIDLTEEPERPERSNQELHSAIVSRRQLDQPSQSIMSSPQDVREESRIFVGTPHPEFDQEVHLPVIGFSQSAQQPHSTAPNRQEPTDPSHSSLVSPPHSNHRSSSPMVNPPQSNQRFHSARINPPQPHRQLPPLWTSPQPSNQQWPSLMISPQSLNQQVRSTEITPQQTHRPLLPNINNVLPPNQQHSNMTSSQQFQNNSQREINQTASSFTPINQVSPRRFRTPNRSQPLPISGGDPFSTFIPKTDERRYFSSNERRSLRTHIEDGNILICNEHERKATLYKIPFLSTEKEYIASKRYRLMEIQAQQHLEFKEMMGFGCTYSISPDCRQYAIGYQYKDRNELTSGCLKVFDDCGEYVFECRIQEDQVGVKIDCFDRIQFLPRCYGLAVTSRNQTIVFDFRARRYLHDDIIVNELVRCHPDLPLIFWPENPTDVNGDHYIVVWDYYLRTKRSVFIRNLTRNSSSNVRYVTIPKITGIEYLTIGERGKLLIWFEPSLSESDWALDPRMLHKQLYFLDLASEMLTAPPVLQKYTQSNIQCFAYASARSKGFWAILYATVQEDSSGSARGEPKYGAGTIDILSDTFQLLCQTSPILERDVGRYHGYKMFFSKRAASIMVTGTGENTRIWQSELTYQV